MYVLSHEAKTVLKLFCSNCTQVFEVISDHMTRSNDMDYKSVMHDLYYVYS